MHHYQNKRDNPGDFFPMPKAAFRLGLDSGEIAVLAFLMYCEDRKTYQCHPSYSTIGSAVGMSNNTVKKYVDRLEHKGFIYTEPTMVRTRDGRAHNGSLLYNLPDHPGTYQGHSLSVSDIVEVIGDSEDVEVGRYFVDSVGFKKVDFDSTQCAEMDGLRMLMIQPHKTPVVTYVKDELDSLQMAVSDHCEDAYIEYTYPFDDDCMVLGNEEAKLNGMEGNRRLGNSIYAGPIFITRDNGVGGLCTLQPIQPIEEAYFERQLREAESRMHFNNAIKKFEKKGGRVNEAVDV